MILLKLVYQYIHFAVYSLMKIFMKKVYADPSLGISPAIKFDLPEDYNPCSRKAAEQDDFEEVGTGSIDEVFE